MSDECINNFFNSRSIFFNMTKKNKIGDLLYARPEFGDKYTLLNKTHVVDM